MNRTLIRIKLPLMSFVSQLNYIARVDRIIHLNLGILTQVKPTLCSFFTFTIKSLLIRRFSSRSLWFVRADYTVISCSIQINVLSEV